MKEFKTWEGNFLAIKLPELCVFTLKKYQNFVDSIAIKSPEINGSAEMPLLEGNYKIIGLLREIKEKEAIEILGVSKVTENITVLELLTSVLYDYEIYIKNPFGEKPNVEAFNNDEDWSNHFHQWKQAQQNTCNWLILKES